MDPTESMKHLPTLMKVYTNELETPDEETRHDVLYRSMSWKIRKEIHHCILLITMSRKLLNEETRHRPMYLNVLETPEKGDPPLLSGLRGCFALW